MHLPEHDDHVTDSLFFIFFVAWGAPLWSRVPPPSLQTSCHAKARVHWRRQLWQHWLPRISTALRLAGSTIDSVDSKQFLFASHRWHLKTTHTLNKTRYRLRPDLDLPPLDFYRLCWRAIHLSTSGDAFFDIRQVSLSYNVQDSRRDFHISCKDFRVEKRMVYSLNAAKLYVTQIQPMLYIPSTFKKCL